MRAVLVYDGDCPFCSAFVRHVRVDEAVGDLELVNAREHPEIVASLRARGLDVDEGMVLTIDGSDYHGDEALQRLALMSTRYGIFNRVNAWAFSNPTVSRIAYPVLKAGRDLALRLLRRGRIHSPHSHDDHCV
jgi:predicted DCC family thiol-disulfide oxidoreductase YuxK